VFINFPGFTYNLWKRKNIFKEPIYSIDNILPGEREKIPQIPWGKIFL
jgi:hypothetical protein